MINPPYPPVGGLSFDGKGGKMVVDGRKGNYGVEKLPKVPYGTHCGIGDSDRGFGELGVPSRCGWVTPVCPLLTGSQLAFHCGRKDGVV